MALTRLTSALVSIKSSVVGTVKRTIANKFDLDLSLEDFGADPTGNTDSTAAVIAALSSRKRIVQKGGGIYRLDGAVVVPTGDVHFEGAGIGKTVFRFNHFTQGFRLGDEADSGNRYIHVFRKATIERPNYASYTGQISPKSLYISNSRNGLVEDIDLSGSIGYGIQFDYSDTYVMVRRCYVHDHFGGSSVAVGTDGIHFYRTKDFWAIENTVARVGDDAISCGTFNFAYPVSNGHILFNKIYNTQGTIKIYTKVSGVTVKGNYIDGSVQGGVYITNDANAPENAAINDITIEDNKFYNIFPNVETNIEAGPLRIRGWKGGACSFNNIIFKDNYCSNTYAGINFLVNSANQRLRNLYVEGNIFFVQALGTTNSRSAIMLQCCDENLVVRNNTFKDTSGGLLQIDAVGSGFTAEPSSNGRFTITGNQVEGWNKSVTVGRSALRGIFLRQNLYDCIVEITNNKLQYQYTSGSAAKGRAVETAGVHPDSRFENNVLDGNVLFNSNNGGYFGSNKTIADLTSAPGPRSGTHQRGSSLRTEVPTATRYNEYLIVKSGTLDTISATVTIDSGSYSGTITSGSLLPGVYVTVAGLSDVLRVLRVAGSSVLFDSKASATVTDAATVNSNPTWLARSLVPA